jgi:transposase-like protein
VPDCSAASLLPIIQGKTDLRGIVHGDGWRDCYDLVSVGYDKPIRITPSVALAKGHAHSNGIEAFWSFVKRRLAKFNGLPQSSVPLHLKECE